MTGIGRTEIIRFSDNALTSTKRFVSATEKGASHLLTSKGGKPKEKINGFDAFRNYCFSLNENQKAEEFLGLKGFYQNLKTKAQKQSQIDKFCELTEQIADKLINSKNPAQREFSGILYGRLIKTYETLNQPEKVITTVDKVLPYHIEQKDYLHVNSKLISKAEAYEQLNDPNKQHKALLEEYKYLKYIIKNYSEACDNYSSILRKPAPLSVYEFEFSKLCNKLSKFDNKTNKNKAHDFLAESEQYYSKYGDSPKPRRHKKHSCGLGKKLRLEKQNTGAQSRFPHRKISPSYINFLRARKIFGKKIQLFEFTD